jgi:hypothetical protein
VIETSLEEQDEGGIVQDGDDEDRSGVEDGSYHNIRPSDFSVYALKSGLPNVLVSVHTVPYTT